MLSPQTRTLLRDALRPPAGYEINRAILTTYSLDLMTLLTVPLAFTLFEMKDNTGLLKADPLALVEALRRHVGQMTIFCQEGQIHLPKNVQLLLGYLERSVVQVTSPRQGGVFHPKIAVLRYTSKDNDAVSYRLLCSSRNLTFDRSWDTLLVLEGELDRDRKNAHARNRPLADFIRALPQLVPPHAPKPDLHDVTSVADELLKVRFTPPEGFEDDLQFCPIGIAGGSVWPVIGGQRSVTISPFVTDGFVQRLAEQAGKHWLISRHESLDELASKSLGTLQGSFFLHDGVEPTPTETEPATDTNPSDDQVHVEPSHQLSGLHAKLFVVDDGWHANIWTGSANATTAAFEKNVEFLVRLRGRKSKFGVNTLLNLDTEDETGKSDRTVRFADMLMRYEREGDAVIDEIHKKLEDAIEMARSAIIGAALQGRIEPFEEGSGKYRLVVSSTQGDRVWPENLRASMSLITIKSEGTQFDLSHGKLTVAFEPLSFEALTSFVSFRLIAAIGDRELTCAFVLKLPVFGFPADREERILLSLLKNRQQLLRYLLLLLANDEDAASQLEDMLSKNAGNRSDSAGGFGLPLLEPLLQAFDRDPSRLAQIDRLISDLLKTPEGTSLIPPDFIEIWSPIWEASTISKNRGVADD